MNQFLFIYPTSIISHLQNFFSSVFDSTYTYSHSCHQVYALDARASTNFSQKKILWSCELDLQTSDLLKQS